jgi:hypothetical protein
MVPSVFLVPVRRARTSTTGCRWDPTNSWPSEAVSGNRLDQPGKRLTVPGKNPAAPDRFVPMHHSSTRLTDGHDFLPGPLAVGEPFVYRRDRYTPPGAICPGPLPRHEPPKVTATLHTSVTGHCNLVPRTMRPHGSR